MIINSNFPKYSPTKFLVRTKFKPFKLMIKKNSPFIALRIMSLKSQLSKAFHQVVIKNRVTQKATKR